MRSKSKGFTMIEIVVIISMILILSLVILSNFGGINERSLINRGARDLALAIRKAQNMSMAVTQVTLASGEIATPPAIGVKISSLPGENNTYTLFADVIAPNYRLDEGEQILGETGIFERNIIIKTVKDASGSLVGGSSNNMVYIFFAAPEADISIRNYNGIEIFGERAEVELGTSSQRPGPLLQKKLLVTTSGQITIK